MLIGMAGLGYVGSKYAAEPDHGDHLPLSQDSSADLEPPQSTGLTAETRKESRQSSELQQIPHQTSDERSRQPSIESQSLFGAGFVTSKLLTNYFRLLAAGSQAEQYAVANH